MKGGRDRQRKGYHVERNETHREAAERSLRSFTQSARELVWTCESPESPGLTWCVLVVSAAPTRHRLHSRFMLSLLKVFSAVGSVQSPPVVQQHRDIPPRSTIRSRRYPRRDSFDVCSFTKTFTSLGLSKVWAQLALGA